VEEVRKKEGGGEVSCSQMMGWVSSKVTTRLKPSSMEKEVGDTLTRVLSAAYTVTETSATTAQAIIVVAIPRWANMVMCGGGLGGKGCYVATRQCLDGS